MRFDKPFKIVHPKMSAGILCFVLQMRIFLCWSNLKKEENIAAKDICATPMRVPALGKSE